MQGIEFIIIYFLERIISYKKQYIGDKSLNGDLSR